MVDSIKPTSGNLPVSQPTYKAGNATTAISPAGDKEHSQPNWNKVERRKKKDRRLLQSSKDPKFEMRASRGRRREDRAQPSIETKA
jgi:hypothetical protein